MTLKKLHENLYFDLPMAGFTEKVDLHTQKNNHIITKHNENGAFQKSEAQQRKLSTCIS